MDKKNLLVISGLDIWSMGKGKGAQSLYQTLAGYAGSGWQVHFLTGNKSRILFTTSIPISAFTGLICR